MDSPRYALVLRPDRWEGIRDGEVWYTWPYETDPDGPEGLLVQLSYVVQRRWGRIPEWKLLPGQVGWVAV